jgi:hypothetical protein
VIPQGGAEIALLRAPGGVSSLEEWARKEFYANTRQVAEPVRIRLPGPTNRIALEVQKLVEMGPGVEQAVVVWYFAVGDSLFKVELAYWPGNQNEGALKQTALRVASSVKAK